MRPATLLAVMLSLAACSSTGPSDRPTTPSDLPRSYASATGPNTVRATVDGVAWSAPVISFNRSYIGNVLRFYGWSDPFLGIDIKVENITGPGTYPLARKDGFGPGPGAIVFLFGSKGAWLSLSGSMTIATVDANGASGTFQFTADPDPATKTSGQLQVTNGSFNLTF